MDTCTIFFNYNTIDIINIIIVYKYLMKKYDIKCLD